MEDPQIVEMISNLKGRRNDEEKELKIKLLFFV